MARVPRGGEILRTDGTIINEADIMVSTILAKDSQNNAIATATAPAGTANQRYYLSGYEFSYSVTGTAGILQILDGAVVIFEHYVASRQFINFIQPLMLTPGNSVSIVLSASGTAGVIGNVDLRGSLQ